MQKERKRPKVRSSFLSKAKWCVCAAAVTVSGSTDSWARPGAGSTALDQVEDISIAVKYDQKNLCNRYGRQVSLSISVKNTLSFENTAVIIDSIDTTEVEYASLAPAALAKLERPAHISEHTWTERPGRIRPSKGVAAMADGMLRKGAATAVSADFEIPAVDGYYNETIIVRWHLSKAPDGFESVPGASKKRLYYQVKNGCVSWMKMNDYYEAATPRHQYTGYKHGKKVTMNDMQGYRQDTKDDVAYSPDLDRAKVRVLDEEDRPVSDAISGESDMRESSLKEGSVLKLKYCVRIQLRHDFSPVPSNTTGMGWNSPRGDGSLHNYEGNAFELWDYDSTGEDDYLGEIVMSYDSDGAYGCYSFSWDQDAHGELYPDPYIRTEHKVFAPGYIDRELAMYCGNSDCDVGYTWRNFYHANLGQDSTTFTGSFDFGDVGGLNNRIAMVMTPVQKMLELVNSGYMTHNLKVYYGESESSYQTGYDEIYIAEDHYPIWTISAHEAGHAYHKQLLGRSSLHNSCPSPHYFTGAHNYHCATTEGWANFIGLASWYSGTAAGVDPRYATTTTTLRDMENGKYHDSCDDNAKTEGMAAKAFWDMYDNHADTDTPVNDTADRVQTIYDIALTWRNFPSGSGNAEDDESDMNMRDYHHNSQSISTDAYEDVAAAMLQNDMFCQSWP